MVRLIGGLGNQMFQYAAGRALALIHQVPLGLDTSAFTSYTLHQGLELSRVFGLDLPQVADSQLRKSFGWRVSPLAKRLAGRWPYFPLASRHVIIEPHLDYWSGILKAPAEAYLIGYWQSDLYFRESKDNIRSDFQFKTPLEGRALDWAERIQAVPSVSLHIRRGDYITNPTAAAYHGICSLNYYKEAISRIAQQINQPEFFVFSDDLAWARSNLKSQHQMHFVDCNSGANSYRDMQLMSLCRHHIIANSSFSWWGAWLSPCASKRVFAPARWFAGRQTPKGLLPSDWALVS